MSSPLQILQNQTHTRSTEITANHPDWPCRKGCADCCRSLASVPRLTHAEWLQVDNAIQHLPAPTAGLILQRIQNSASATRPVVCPMLDTEAGACLIYDARPIACRAYGFYAERQNVLGCSRIEAIARQEHNDVIWGNHTALEENLRSLAGPAFQLHHWLSTAIEPDK